MERACVTLGAIRNIRIRQFQIKGPERKNTHGSLRRGNISRGSRPHYGRIERIVDDAAKTAGLTKTQFEDWGQIGRVETRTKGGRGRSLSKRRKERRETNGRVDRETSANRSDRQRKADEDRRRNRIRRNRNNRRKRKRTGRKEITGKGDEKRQRRERTEEGRGETKGKGGGEKSRGKCKQTKGKEPRITKEKGKINI